MSNMVAIRDAYGEALAELGNENQEVVVLDADVGGSSKSIIFGKSFPERYFNMGIAEGGMAATAAGLATTGKIPFVNTFACFLSLRAADPIRSLIAYSGLNVKLAGTYCGMSDSYDGASHHSITDMAVMRAFPNMTVISVCDAVETKKAVKAVSELDGPVYLRLSRAPVKTIMDEDYNFEVGKSVTLREGKDVTLIATGYMVQKSLEAAELLESEGISARVVNMHTIKPIDEEAVVSAAKDTEMIVTVEEHNVVGGLGSAVAEVLAKKSPARLEMMGIQDTFTRTGDYEALLEYFNLDSKSIANSVKEFVSKK